MSSSDDLIQNERELLVAIADNIAERARGYAAQFSTRIPEAIKVSEVSEWQNGLGIYVIVDRNEAPQALMLEVGAPPHDIDAVNVDFLKFPGTHGWTGQTIIIPHVDHPGFQGKHYMKQARDEVRPLVQPLLKDILHRTMSQVIRTNWKPVHA